MHSEIGMHTLYEAYSDRYEMANSFRLFSSAFHADLMRDAGSIELASERGSS